MAETLKEFPNDGDLLDTVKDALLGCGCTEHCVDVLLDSILVEGADDNRSVLVGVTFKPFDTDEGRISPATDGHQLTGATYALQFIPANARLTQAHAIRARLLARG